MSVLLLLPLSWYSACEQFIFRGFMNLCTRAFFVVAGGVFFLPQVGPLFAQNVAFAQSAVRFAAIGDTGTAEPDQFVVADQLQRTCHSLASTSNVGCDFALLLGDNFYPAGVKSADDPQFKTKFEVPYAPLGIPFFAVLGNHDYGFLLQRGNPQAQVDYTQKSKVWKMPARSYSFQKGNVEFFAIDTNRISNDSAQQNWLLNALETSQAQWKIVFGHHPIYSNGAHGNTPALISKVLPTLCGRADFYFSGHDHDLQVLNAECGLKLIVSGAGAKTRPTASGSRSEFSAEALGFAHMTVDGNSAQLKMIDVAGKELFAKTYTK